MIWYGMMYPTLSALDSLENATPATLACCRSAKAGPPLLPTQLYIALSRGLAFLPPLKQEEADMVIEGGWV